MTVRLLLPVRREPSGAVNAVRAGPSLEGLLAIEEEKLYGEVLAVLLLLSQLLLHGLRQV